MNKNRTLSDVINESPKVAWFLIGLVVGLYIAALIVTNRH